jgi:hypothetical protein
MLGGIYSSTREEAIDRHLFTLAAIFDASHGYTDAKVLQNWLSDVIEHLKALPEAIQIALGLALFKIGDEHFHWGADQIKTWQKIASVIAGGHVFQREAAQLRSNASRRDVASAPPPRSCRSRLVVTGGIATLIVAVVVDIVALGHSSFPALSQETGDRPPLLVQASRVTSGQPAFLGLTLQGRADDAVVIITGLVPGMTLSTGSKIGVDTWEVPATALPSAWIVPPTNFVGVLDLVAELHLADRTVVDRRRIKLEWQEQIPAPAAASPMVTTDRTVSEHVAPSGQRDADEPAVAPPRELNVAPSPDEIVVLLKRGQELMRNGDLAAARLVLQHAAEAKSAEAALMLGGTYDPVILRELKVYGFSADVGMARTWYEKAKELGSPEAARRLDILAR